MREKEKENKPISIAERAPASGLEGWNKKPTWILDHHLTPTNVHLPSSALQTSGPTMKITIVTMYRYKTLPKPLVTAQRTQGIEYFDSFNTFTSKQKLQQALKSWSTFSLVLFGKGQKIHRKFLTNPCINSKKNNIATLTNPCNN